MLKIETRIDPFEIDETRRSGLPHEADQLIVRKHNHSGAVILDWRGHSISVDAGELRRAIENATNHH